MERLPKPPRLLGLLTLAALGFVSVGPSGCGGSDDGLARREGGGSGGGVVVVTPSNDAGDPIGPVDPGIGGPTNPPADGGGPVFADANVVPDATGCTTSPPVRGPYPRTCRAATSNECDGRSDFPGFANGSSGNGYDDDCDGLVDEGCSCPAPGTTKTCFLVSGGQIDPATKEPVGWCKNASRGTVDCVGQEFPTWSGVCRGASPPFQDDKCAPGDYDCDGRELNSFTKDCVCETDAVTCPTTPFETVPYPNPQALPLKIDAAAWFRNPANAVRATNWKWTLRGGDCDNITPHPSFGLFKTNNGTGAPLGRTVVNLGRAANEKGREVTQAQDGVTTELFPAFSLSGDYIMDVSLDYGGQKYACSLNIRVKGPGLRAEACWDTMGPTDVDLHMVKVNGFNCATPGWSGTCANQDCLFQNCRPNEGGMTRWYGTSPASACVGWGSFALPFTNSCPNPRLDRDTVTCFPTEQNPAANFLGVSAFCGSENINVDAPQNGDTFAVGTVLYSGANARPHVNVYCNGRRIVSAGYNPLTGANFPVLNRAGMNDGDFWKFGLVRISGSGSSIACEVLPTRPSVANRTNPTYTVRDGQGGTYCVDKDGNSTKNLWRSASVANTADGLCFH